MEMSDGTIQDKELLLATEDDNPFTDTNKDRVTETDTKQDMSEEPDKDRMNNKESQLPETVHNSKTGEEPDTVDGMLSEEFVKDREQYRIFEKPMCLISCDGGRLEVVEETLKELEKIEMQLNVVAIAGLYRTGKSYLMNRLAGQNSGFIMGNSIESTTKGIWAWCRKHPKKESEVLLLLDTEGLGDATKGNIDHDNKIFTITTLLSSTLVYNVMSAFNQDAIEKLTYVTMLSQNLRVSSNNPSDDDDLESIMPQFVLCVRDFSLELVQNGEKITEDEYLETCLKTRVAETKEDENYNRPRECIKKYFTRRKVFTFDRPASRRVMGFLDRAREEDLNEDFIQETDKFLTYIYTCHGKYLPNRVPVTGSMMAKLLREYVTAISAGNVPCVEDAMMIMTRQENEKHTKNAIEEYKLQIEQIQLPVYNKNELSNTISKFKDEILSHLQSTLLFDTDNEIEKATEAEMRELYRKLEKSNSDMLYDKYTCRLNEIYNRDVKVNIERRRYAVSGGHAVYEKDMRLLYDKFYEEFKSMDNTEKKRAQNDFESKMMHESKQILQEDKVLSEKGTQDVMIKKLDEMKKDMIQSQEVVIGKLEKKLDKQRSFYEDKIRRAEEEEKEKEKRRNDEIREMREAHAKDQERLDMYKNQQIQMMMMKASADAREREKWCCIS